MTTTQENIQLQALRLRVNELTAQLETAKQERMTVMTQFLNNFNNNDNLKKAIISKDNEINTISKQLNSKVEEIVLIRKQLITNSGELHTLKQQLVTMRNENIELCHQLSKATNELQTIKLSHLCDTAPALNEKDKIIQSLTSQLDKANKDIQDLKNIGDDKMYKLRVKAGYKATETRLIKKYEEEKTELINTHMQEILALKNEFALKEQSYKADINKTKNIKDNQIKKVYTTFERYTQAKEEFESLMKNFQQKVESLPEYPEESLEELLDEFKNNFDDNEESQNDIDNDDNDSNIDDSDSNDESFNPIIKRTKIQ